MFLQAEVPALLSNPNNPTLNGFDGTALTNFADNNARVSALSSAFPMSNVPNIVNAVNDARSHFGDGTANPDVIAGNLSSLMVDSVIANNTGNPINMPDARATLKDTIAAFMTDESGGVSFDQAQQSAGRFVDALGSMLDRPGFEAAFKNGLLSGIGSTFGDLAELANALYEPFKTGIKTGDWSDFGGVALELGIGTVLSGLAIAGLGAAVSLAFGPAVGAAFAAAVLAYGLWEGFNAFFNLGSAILKDMLDGDFQQYILNPLIKWIFDPLTLDLDGDGIELVSLANSNVNFDLDGNGFAERTGWVSSDDGMLVRDGNRNGNVDSIAELFGSATQDGFAVLETFDDNHDGRIDAQDAEFNLGSGYINQLAAFQVSTLTLSVASLG